CAFARSHEGELAITVVGRLYLRLLGERADAPLGEASWGETFIELPRTCPAGTRLKNVLDGTVLTVGQFGPRPGIRLADALAQFPVALLTLDGRQPGRTQWLRH
ncbi:MAG TPA: hypothetical protein VLX90_11790, partial [Steroidobacteraceae bacterium]|nr:hypothetical protein [Steroidobacteraceae bacterium]